MPVEIPLSTSQLESIAQEHGTPFQIYDESMIRENARSFFREFRSAFDDFREFFAVKATPNPSILAILIQEGCGLDCSSTAEIVIAKALGVAGEDIIYTSNYTSDNDLAFAFDQGVIINLDDISLVDALIRVRGRLPEILCFRLNPGLGNTASETKSNVLGGPNAKFGVPPTQIVNAYHKAKENGVKRFGIHMMTGSCVLNTDYWMETVSILLNTVADIRREVGIEFEFINIGGGLGIPYYPDQTPVDLRQLVSRLSDLMQRKAQELNMPLPRLSMENGRYLTGPYGWLVSRCHVIKDSWQRYYGLDACMAHLMRPGMYEAYHHITIPDREAHPRQSANVVGTLCENNDWFAKDRSLPEAQVGDLFVIHDTGAHGHSMGFQYNGKLRAPELLIRASGHVDLVRKRETIFQLYENVRIPFDILSVPKQITFQRRILCTSSERSIFRRKYMACIVLSVLGGILFAVGKKK